MRLTRKAMPGLLLLVLVGFRPALADTNFTAEDADQRFTDLAGKYKALQRDVTTAFTGALDNFQVTVQSASSREASPDILGVLAKFALKEGVKKGLQAAGAGEAVPLIDIAEKISAEIERASKAAESVEVATWIKNLRAAVIDASNRQGEAQIVEDLRNRYRRLQSDDDKNAFMDDVVEETAAIEQAARPTVDPIERSLNEGWINAHYDQCGEDGTGRIEIRFKSDQTLDSAKVNAPQSDKIEDALNRLQGRGAFSRLMDLQVYKFVCLYGDKGGGEGWKCGCFDDRNAFVMRSIFDDADTFLQSESWRSVSSFNH